jgi:hypothetical protein
MYERLCRGPETFRYVDAAQLVKHYFGLKAWCERNGGRRATLLYLYWEPLEADRHPDCGNIARRSSAFARLSMTRRRPSAR